MSADQSVSISSWVSRETTSDTASLNVNIGPPLSATKLCPSASNSTVITEPGSLPDGPELTSSYRSTRPSEPPRSTVV